MFFGHPGSWFSLRGLSKPRDFYVFRASRIPIQCSRFEQTSWFLWFSGIQDPDSVFAVWANLVIFMFFGIQGLDKAFPFKWNTRVFIVFRRPGSKSGTRLVRLGCPWKTIVLLQQGAIFLEKPWFCCNRVPFSSKNNGFVATGYHFPRKTILYYSLGEGFKGGGFEVCGRQDLDFKFRKK